VEGGRRKPVAIFFFDGHNFERVKYRIVKDKLMLLAPKVTYTFKASKDALTLSLGKHRKQYRRVVAKLRGPR
jgi:hypothetical protein